MPAKKLLEYDGLLTCLSVNNTVTTVPLGLLFWRYIMDVYSDRNGQPFINGWDRQLERKLDKKVAFSSITKARR